MAFEILEERDRLEDIAPQAERDSVVTDEVRDTQKPLLFQAVDRRALHSGVWVDKKPKLAIDTAIHGELEGACQCVGEELLLKESCWRSPGTGTRHCGLKEVGRGGCLNC